jgi:hypothetical protein
MNKTSEWKLDHMNALRRRVTNRELKLKREPAVQLPKRKIKLKKFSEFFREIQSRRNDTADERLSSPLHGNQVYPGEFYAMTCRPETKQDRLAAFRLPALLYR